MWIHPKRNTDVALQCDDQSLTYEALHERIDQKLYLLHSNALTGLRIALDLPESFAMIEWTAANWVAGNTVLLLDQRLKAGEKEQRLQHFSPDMVISSLSAGSQSAVSAFVTEVPVYLEDYDIERRYRLTAREQQDESERPLFALYSSGSAGIPKPIIRSRGSLQQELDQYSREPLVPKEGSSVLCLAALSHSFGLLSACFHTLRAGGTVHFAPILKPKAVMRGIKQHRITHIYGVLFHYQLLERSLSLFDETDQRPLCLVSGGPVPDSLFQRYKQAGVALGSQYGMSEVGYIAVDFSGSKPGSCGPIANHHRWNLDEDGQLLLGLMKSPYAETQPNWFSAGIESGWLHTQDLIAVDNEGSIAIRGRMNRQASIGGLKVNLDEVELKLAEHPHIDQCCVVSRDHSVYGTVLEAFLVWNKQGEIPIAELKSWLQAGMADYKIPKSFRTVAEIPMSASGKVLRGELLKESLNGYQSTG